MEEIKVVCGWGRCANYYTPGKDMWGWGAMGCPCDTAPGWRSKSPYGLPQPQMPVKIKGRHGSRVQRSHRRKDKWEQYYLDIQEMLGR